MGDLWQPDPRLLRTIAAPSGTKYTIRLDGVAHGLAQEAQTFVASLPSHDPVASWIRDELHVATESLRLGITSALLEEKFAALGFCRVVVESAIRFSWLVAEGPVKSKVRTRLGKLEKRDLQKLLDASKAVAELSMIGHLVDNEEELRSHLKSLEEPAAPDPRTMAREAGWEWLYALHRLCSVGIHPGLGTRAAIWDAVDAAGLAQLLHWSYSGAVTAAGGVALALFDSDPTLIKTNAIVFSKAGISPASSEA